jgi:hypothetical protein
MQGITFASAWQKYEYKAKADGNIVYISGISVYVSRNHVHEQY